MQARLRSAASTTLAQYVLSVAGDVLGGRQGGPARDQDAGAVKTLQKENATLKTLVGEITLANDALKKHWRGEKSDGRTATNQQDMSEQGSPLMRGNPEEVVSQAEGAGIGC